MSTCAVPLSMARLIDYWFAEAVPEDSLIEEHLMACAACSARLHQLAALSAGIKQIVTTGDFGAVVTAPFVTRLKQAGLRVREYRVPTGGSVLCTIAPQDDLVIGRLSASLTGIDRLDVISHDPVHGAPVRLEDVPFDAEAGEVLFTPGTTYLRALDTATQRVELVAVAAAGEQVVGEYTFNHHRYAP
jgi:hypothetical protein